MKNRFLTPIFAVLAFLFIISLTACNLQRSAPPPSPADTPETEISQDTLRTQILSLNKRYENLDARVADDHRRIESLEEELLSLRGSRGSLSPAQRSHGVEKATARPSGEPPKPKPLSPTPSSQDPRKLYDTSLKAYYDKDYPTAISRFQEFVNAFPSSDLADNALYWIGESYYAKEDFERAISSFLKVVDRYPNGNKVPDALFKIGLSYSRGKNSQKAREFYTRVMDNYPFSEAAKKAQVNLGELD